MKNKLFALGFAALFMVSCSDDDNEAVIRKSELTRTWYPASYKVGNTVTPHDHQAGCNRDNISFDEEGSFMQVEYAEGCAVTTSTGEYSVSGNRITINIGEQTTVGTIKELTENKLVVVTKYDFDGDGDEETVRETYASAP
ncbi:lipocalin family protein [Flavobacterium sp. MK4S-17]|uniref:lipocalin family protein n=1 Tax=Flavobacterium sp. MK4S-17 TaxID=2543737 RepID=UPI00135BE90F|nr:lipocalin family protein [Flavobacterium sp. MK4S-17]